MRNRGVGGREREKEREFVCLGFFWLFFVLFGKLPSKHIGHTRMRGTGESQEIHYPLLFLSFFLIGVILGAVPRPWRLVHSISAFTPLTAVSVWLQETDRT